MSLFTRRIFSITLTCLFVTAIAASVQGQDTNKVSTAAKPAKPAPKKEAKAPAFTGKLGTVDNVLKTITLDEKMKRVFQISSDTLITKDGKPAILADAKPGDAIRGTYRKSDDGKLEALLLNFGAKSEPAKPAAKPRKTPPAATNSVPTNAPGN